MPTSFFTEIICLYNKLMKLSGSKLNSSYILNNQIQYITITDNKKSYDHKIKYRDRKCEIKKEMTYTIVFVVVAEDRKSSILSELCHLCNDVVIDGLQDYHGLRIAWTNLQQWSHFTAGISGRSNKHASKICTGM